MLIRFLLLAPALVQCQQVLHLGNNHPAAGPDLSGHIARNLVDDQLLEDDAGTPAVLVDPDGRRFIAPLKAKTAEIEKERRLEEQEILRILETPAIESKVPWSTWLWSMLGCALVVSCGIVPAFLLPVNTTEYLHTEDGRRHLNLLLSFAVGSLLGDVFLHLLPETWNNYNVNMGQVGAWTIGGLLICFLVEKLCSTTEESQHRVCAFMNLAANIIDNFTHGLAVGASFLISPKCGLLTTFAILLHEIPHEISDFAILLRADFNRIDAIKAQLVTATGGVLGACAALYMHGDDIGAADWILPFTAGGFINIALAQILPELHEEMDTMQSLKQLLCIGLGVATMAILNQGLVI